MTTRKNMKKVCINPLYIIMLAFCCGSTLKAEVSPSPRVLQEISMLSASQFYTQFALVRTMLEGTWNQKVYEQFAYYDGINLNLMKRYGDQLKDDPKWGPFFKMQNTLHLEVYEALQPLIAKKRKDEPLTDSDRKRLEELDKQIFAKLIK